MKKKKVTLNDLKVERAINNLNRNKKRQLLGSQTDHVPSVLVLIDQLFNYDPRRAGMPRLLTF